MPPENPDNSVKKNVTVREWIVEEKKQSPEKPQKNVQKLLSEDSLNVSVLNTDQVVKAGNSGDLEKLVWGCAKPIQLKQHIVESFTPDKESCDYNSASFASGANS
jgi:hypothetical protein